jgi:hypothetical protein
MDFLAFSCKSNIFLLFYFQCSVAIIFFRIDNKKLFVRNIRSIAVVLATRIHIY